MGSGEQVTRSPVATPAGPDAAALDALDEAAGAISAVLDLETVLQLIVDRVRVLLDARYAALGIVGPDGIMESFITSGLGPDERAAIGHIPLGRGVLGVIIRDGRTIRVPDISAHPESFGFPPNHPPMRSFLGAPIAVDGRIVGNLYMTEKLTADEFSKTDERLVEMFARHAGIAIVNALLHRQAGRLAVIEERDRIGRDLHDGIIQSLYGIALALEVVPDLVRDAPIEADQRVDRAIEGLNRVIGDIRLFIHGLQPEALGGVDLGAGLAALAQEHRRNTTLEAELAIDASADPGLGPEGNTQLLQLAREAMSNVARHARARRLRIELRREAQQSVLEIADDGIGFDHATAADPSHRGLLNMRARADAIGARLSIDSGPGEGTRITVWMAPAQTEGDAT